MDRRTLMMNWDGLIESNEDDVFFESRGRFSSAVPLDLPFSRSDSDDDFDDSRLSFSSCVSSASCVPLNGFRNLEAPRCSTSILQDYGVWIAEPGDIKERRKRLLRGMGLASKKDLVKLASSKIVRTISRKIDARGRKDPTSKHILEDSKEEPSPFRSTHRILLVRSRSDGDIEFHSLNAKKRKEELIGPGSKQRITRTSSVLIATNSALSPYANSIRISPEKQRSRSLVKSNGDLSSLFPGRGFNTFFLIKDLDTGKEFIVKEFNENGLWNKLSDLETGKQLTMEEFEKSVGYSPIVKEQMRRGNVSKNLDDNRRKMKMHSYLSKSFRNSKRRGAAFLKNVKGVANSMSGLINVDKEREYSSSVGQKASKNSSQWVKVRQHGKSYKEFTALYSCQEIQAHQGSIWTIKFSSDARFLASAGEDTVVHIWEVQECEILSTRPPDDLNSVSGTPVHPMANISEQHPPLAEISPMPSEKRRKGRSSSKRRGDSIPEYVNLPETVFGLSEKPVCTFKGHLDAVLDLSWSTKQLLLSSSMDKTVRLWDLETGSCLKLFAHNDYVTCIQFNPANDGYFISGSLDSKVRIWSVTDSRVVDWTDRREMVTAACYTPDGRGAIVGSHKGNCRLYLVDDYRLGLPKDLVGIKKKKKSQATKITGVQCSPCNPTEVLISSADSRIRIFDRSEIVHKFKGLRNTGSQISASFTPDGKYIVSASEDNNVFIWKREVHRNAGAGKGRTKITTHAHEHFQCRDVSVAIPWPGSTKHEPPLVALRSKRHSRRSSAPPQSFIGSPIHEELKRHLPPLPRKSSMLQRISSCPDQDLAQSSFTDSGIGANDFMSASSSSLLYTDSPSISASGRTNSRSLSPSLSLTEGRNSHRIHTAYIPAHAWGLVILTATLEGEIRVYQNFGLPLKVSRGPIPSKISHKDFQL